MKLKLISFALALLAFIPVFGTLISVTTSPAFAQQSNQTFAQEKATEAKMFTVTNAMLECVRGDKGSGLNSPVKLNNLGSEVAVSTRAGRILVGHHVDAADGSGECADGKWFANALDILGITTHSDFMNAFYDQGTDELAGSWVLKDAVVNGGINVTQKLLQLTEARSNPVVTCGARGDCAVSGLSASARYSLYLENYVKGCKASPVSGNEDELNSIDPDKKGFVYIVTSTGEIKPTYYKAELGKAKMISVGQGVVEDGNYSCGTLIQKINELAPAYKEAQQKAKDAGQETGSIDSETSSSGGTTASDNNPSCEITGSPLTWIICPIINGIAEAADFIFVELVQPLLVARDQGYTDPEEELFKVWSSFRTIANILLIVVLLVIVFGQSIGGGMIDAYTVKRALPRLLAAVILINISIYIVALAIDITNIIGAGLSNLIYAPFQNAGEFRIRPGAFTGILGYVGAAGGIWAGVQLAGALASVGEFLPFILLFIVVPAILAILAVVATLVIRQGLIIFLVVISPIAFLAFILPNTEQYFKKWWDLLLKTLLVYPIVMVIFAIADVMSSVLSGSFPIAVQWLADLVSIVLLVLPLFLIPFAFKFAGSAIGAVYGAVSNFGKKSGEALKGDARDPLSLRNQAKFRARSAANENGLSPGALGTKLNPFAGIRGGGGYKGYRERRNARYSAMRNANQAILSTDIANAALVQKAMMDDKVSTDLALYGSSADSRAAIQSRYEKAMAAAGGDPNLEHEAKLEKQQYLAASAMADRIGRTSANRRMAIMNPATIGYGLEPGQAGWDTATTAMRDIANGDESAFRSMVNDFQYQAKSAAGRPDLSGAVDSDIYDGDRAWNTVGLYQHSNSKPADITGSGRHFLRKFRNDIGETNPEKIAANKDDAAVYYKELQGMVNGSTGGVRKAIEEQMAILEQAGMETYLQEAVGETKTVTRRDPNNPNNVVQVQVDKTREESLLAGEISHVRPVKQSDGTTVDMPVKLKVRTYERPDINRLNEEQ